MKMMQQNISFKGENLLKINLRNGFIGILIGVVIAVFTSVFARGLPSPKAVFFNILFSVFISLSITNSVFVYERFLKPARYSLWRFLLGYYGCNAIGMVIGTELAYLLIAVLFNAQYDLMSHLNDYKFNAVVVFVAGSALLLFQVQKVVMQDKINLKELDIVRIKQLKTQAELETLQSKINPHFLYNSLNSIASLIHSDADKAEVMTINLSKFFRYSINSSQETMSSVRQELEILNSYLAIEKVRFGKRITFMVNAADSIMDRMIPRFLIQPLVENALKHGLNNTAANGLLEVTIDQRDTSIIIEISDNGTAFPEKLDMGYGLQSTYDKLNLVYGEAYQMQIINFPKKQVKLTFPIQINA